MDWSGILLLLCLTGIAKLNPAEKDPSKEVPVEQQDAEEKQTDTESKEVLQVDTTANNSSAKNESDASQCKSVVDTLDTSGIPQSCSVHGDCRGACCDTNLLAHNITYNFTVIPCNTPSVTLDFNISDLTGARINQTVVSSGRIAIPGGNMSYQGWYETVSSVEVVLDKVLDITHFRLDFEVQYKVLETDQLQKLFSHTLVPMLSVEYSEELCVKPDTVEDDDDKYFGVIPKDYVKDKKTLALISTSVTLAVIIVIVGIYCIISRKRNSDNFYRTYISTDENRHLTKGNDGFEPLDDSDID